MRAVHEGRAATDETFAKFMDLCLVCRACEDVCPSHVPFGRMMEAARTQIEPFRSRRARFVRWLGLDVVLPSRRLTRLAGALAPLARPFLPSRVRIVDPANGGRAVRHDCPASPSRRGRLRGTVALLSGCVQDLWFRRVNLATIRVLARNGWRVVVPRDADVLRRARRAQRTPRDGAEAREEERARRSPCVDHVDRERRRMRRAHGRRTANWSRAPELPVRDVMAFLHEEGLRGDAGSLSASPRASPTTTRVTRSAPRGSIDQPRELLGAIGNLELVEIPNGDRCCGAAGIYNVTEPEMSGRLHA